MGTKGLTEKGFVRPSFQELLDELKQRAKERFGQDLDWSVGSPIAVFYAALLPEFDLLWQQLENIYWANKIGGARGAALEDLVSFQRITRDPAQKASGVVTFTGDEGAVIPVGTVVSSSITDKEYKTVEKATIPASGQVDVLVEAVEEGPEYNCVAGVIDTIPSPPLGVQSVENKDEASTLQIARFANGSVQIEADGENTTYQTVQKADISHPHKIERIDVKLKNPGSEARTYNLHLELINHSTADPVAVTQSQEISFEAGEEKWVAFDGLSLNITQMDPVFRVACVNEQTSDGTILWLANTTDPYTEGKLYAAGSEQVGYDALLYITSRAAGVFSNGKYEESDAALARRFLVSKARGATAIPEAIIADLWNIEGVRSVSFRQNREDVEVAGLRRRSVEVTVLGGDTQEIAETLLRIVAAGIRTEGNISVLVNDDYGQGHIVRFNRPTEVPLYVRLVLKKGASFPAEDGDDQVRNKVIEYVGGRTSTGSLEAGLNAGETVVVSKIIDAVMDVRGVEDVTVYIGRDENPTESANVEMGPAEKATVDYQDIEVEVA